MRPNILHSVALSLVGLWVADASVCKPRSLSSSVSTIASTTLTAAETNSSGFFSESSASSSSIASASTEVTTGVDATATRGLTESTSTNRATTTIATTSTDVSSTVATITTEADTTTTEATSSTVVSASTEVTSIAESTTTAELPVITNFELQGASDPVDGVLLYSDRVKGHNLIFDGSSIAGFSPATFSIELITGRLLIDDSLPVCAFFQRDSASTIATLLICDDRSTPQEVAITCTQPAKDGDTLSCSVPGMICVQEQVGSESTSTCSPTGDVFTDTSIDFRYDLEKYVAVIGIIENGENFAIYAA